MPNCIQIFTNTCEVTMRVKCIIGKATSNQYIKNTCACIESPNYLSAAAVVQWVRAFVPQVEVGLGVRIQAATDLSH